MTLNDLERQNVSYFALFCRIRQFYGRYYVKLVEDGPIVCKKNVVQ